MKKILIIGVNEFTGRQIVDDLSACKQYKLTGCSLYPDIPPSNAEDYRFTEIDIRNEADVRHLFKEIQPDIVTNCPTLSVPDYCETHHEEACFTSVTAVGQLADLCEEYKSRFIHLSTDFVSDREMNEAAGLLYTKKDLPAPVNYYGYTKWKGEGRMAETCSGYAIVRIGIIYDEVLLGQRDNIVQLIMNRLKAGQEIRVVSDQWRTPTYVRDVSDGVLRSIEHTANGISHIYGNKCMTVAETAYQAADYMKFNRSPTHPATTEKINESTPRPRFSGMSIDKVRTMLEYRPRELKEILANWDKS